MFLFGCIKTTRSYAQTRNKSVSVSVDLFYSINSSCSFDAVLHFYLLQTCTDLPFPARSHLATLLGLRQAASEHLLRPSSQEPNISESQPGDTRGPGWAGTAQEGQGGSHSDLHIKIDLVQSWHQPGTVVNSGPLFVFSHPPLRVRTCDSLQYLSTPTIYP